MGDAGNSSEKYIKDEYFLPEMDILKVGHHGSGYSSSFDFLEQIRPKIVFISIGKNNRYDHLHE